MKRDRRTDADLAADSHHAARLLGETVNLRKAEAGAAANILGGEERLEDPVDLVGRDAATGVADRDRDKLVDRGLASIDTASGRFRDPNRQQSFAIHRV